MGANSLWNHIWKKDLFPIVLSLYIVLLSEKFVVLIFNFWKFGFRFFVKICPNCVLFLIFFARCIIQFRWNQPTQRTETVPFFLLIYIQFFPVLYKTGYFLLHITMIMMYLPTVLSFFGTVSMAILAVFFLQQCFCKLASTSGWILPSMSKLSDCQAFCRY